ncbi:MAG: hypothetical protein LUH03_04445 [Oscillospiraceae bacterium]|nr:hypothetical protein [Oscillospiraceae bacterium]
MDSNFELAFFFVELKSASTKLNNLAASLDSNKIQFSFSKSQGETADKFMELVAKYNELGDDLAQLVREVKESVDMTSDCAKNADSNLASCWASLGSVLVEEG